MIKGYIVNLRPLVPLLVYSESGRGAFEFVVDSGCSGTMTLRPETCRQLNLPVVKRHPAFLADGTERWFEVYAISIDWGGIERKAQIYAVEGDELLGMAMLEGYDVYMSVKEDGIVMIRETPDEENER